jgi:hypothetical protein
VTRWSQVRTRSSNLYLTKSVETEGPKEGRAPWERVRKEAGRMAAAETNLRVKITKMSAPPTI